MMQLTGNLEKNQDLNQRRIQTRGYQMTITEKKASERLEKCQKAPKSYFHIAWLSAHEQIHAFLH